MRDQTIFIRNESAFSCLFGNGLPVFAKVLGVVPAGEDSINPDEETIFYQVDYPVRTGAKRWRWRYGDNRHPIEGSDYAVTSSGTYMASISHFRKLFRPDVYDVYKQFVGDSAPVAA